MAKPFVILSIIFLIIKIFVWNVIYLLGIARL